MVSRVPPVGASFGLRATPCPLGPQPTKAATRLLRRLRLRPPRHARPLPGMRHDPARSRDTIRRVRRRPLKVLATALLLLCATCWGFSCFYKLGADVHVGRRGFGV